MKKTKKVNSKTQPIKKPVKLKSAKYAELQAEAEQIKALHEQNAMEQKKVNYEDLKLALVHASEQMKKFNHTIDAVRYAVITKVLIKNKIFDLDVI